MWVTAAEMLPVTSNQTEKKYDVHVTVCEPQSTTDNNNLFLMTIWNSSHSGHVKNKSYKECFYILESGNLCGSCPPFSEVHEVASPCPLTPPWPVNLI